MNTPAHKYLLAALAATALTVPSAFGAIIFTIEAPGVTQSTVPNVNTENFDDNNPNNVIGTYTGGFLNTANVYGGAGGTGLFLQANSGNPANLTFSTPQSYFGMWWSAGDPANQLRIFDANNVLLESYVIGDIIPFLSDAYRGNPSGQFQGGNTGEYYAYLNFTATGSDYIGRVEFGGSNFESDNHSVTTERITPPGNTIPDSGSTLALTGTAFLGTVLMRRLLGRKRAAK
jgi:hypothetical protein